MALTVLGLPARRGFGQTSRTDAWWIYPLVVATVLLSFLAYATWAAFREPVRKLLGPLVGTVSNNDRSNADMGDIG